MSEIEPDEPHNPSLGIPHASPPSRERVGRAVAFGLARAIAEIRASGLHHNPVPVDVAAAIWARHTASFHLDA